MKGLALRLAIVSVFAVAVGHFAFRSLGPPITPKYYLDSPGEAMQGPDSDGNRGKFLYARHALHLPRQPQNAWLRVVGRDKIIVYVNGQRVGVDGPIHYWSPAALVLDITPYLVIGPNSICVSAQQTVPLRAPVVSVEGGYVLDGKEITFRGDETWHVAHNFQRRKNWWIGSDFDDHNWATAKMVPAELHGQVYLPPRAVCGQRTASWITPKRVVDKTAAVRREFVVDGRVRSGWLRMVSNASYRLAVNDVFIDEQEDGLGVEGPTTLMQRTYDITRALQPGHNVVAVQLITTGAIPHVLADMEVENDRGEIQDLGTGADWLASGELTRDWSFDKVSDQAAWLPPFVETADMGFKSSALARETVVINWPTQFQNKQMTVEIAYILVCFGLGLLLSWVVSRWLSVLRIGLTAEQTEHIAYLALVPSSVLAVSATLAIYDPRFAQQDVYRPQWLLCLLALVGLQWLGLLLAASIRPLAQFSSVGMLRGLRGLHLPQFILLLLVLVGGWLRFRHMWVEPIHHDEVSCYWFTRGVLDAGFPSGQIQKDTPYGYCATSEIAYYPTAIVNLFTDDPVTVLRVPAVLWALATIWLMYFVGKRMFNVWVGIVAATIYTFAPYCIEMSNFGRYFSQLQFITLLCTYFFYKTIEGHGPINKRALWLTGLTFLLMYYSWEGSGFLAIGLVVAALIQRRGQMRTILAEPQIWLAMLVMILGFLIQDSHRIYQQCQRLWWGIGISDLALYPMWRYNNFVPAFYFAELSWLQDAILPMALLVAAMTLAIHHPWQEQLRTILATVLTTAGSMTAVLPLRAARYDYHLVPLLILPAAVVLVVMARRLMRIGGSLRAPVWPRVYASGVAIMLVLVSIGLVSGQGLQYSEMTDFLTLAFRANELKFPHWEELMRIVRENMEEDDVVISTFPHVTDHTMYLAKDHPMPKGWSSDYWLQSTLVLQATVDDIRTLPLDRRAGTLMIPNLPALEEVFAKHKRIWFLVSNGPNNGLNDKNVNQFVRGNMEVVYEDFLTCLMVRDSNNRPMALRTRDEAYLRSGQANFLP
jgi:hypothetical protein